MNDHKILLYLRSLIAVYEKPSRVSADQIMPLAGSHGGSAMISSRARILLCQEEVIRTVTVIQGQEFGWLKQCRWTNIGVDVSCVSLSMVRSPLRPCF